MSAIEEKFVALRQALTDLHGAILACKVSIDDLSRAIEKQDDLKIKDESNLLIEIFALDDLGFGDWLKTAARDCCGKNDVLYPLLTLYGWIRKTEVILGRNILSSHSLDLPLQRAFENSIGATSTLRSKTLDACIQSGYRMIVDSRKIAVENEAELKKDKAYVNDNMQKTLLEN